MNLGNKILNLRKEKGLTQQELADKLFVTDKTISSWESDRTEPDLEMLIKLSEILETSVGNLLYSDNEKNDIETEIKVKLSKEEFERIEKFMKSKAKFLKNSK